MWTFGVANIFVHAELRCVLFFNIHLKRVVGRMKDVKLGMLYHSQTTPKIRWVTVTGGGRSETLRECVGERKVLQLDSSHGKNFFRFAARICFLVHEIRATIFRV